MAPDSNSKGNGAHRNVHGHVFSSSNGNGNGNCSSTIDLDEVSTEELLREIQKRAVLEVEPNADSKLKKTLHFTSYWMVPRILGLAISICWAAFVLSHSTVYFFDEFVWPIIEDSGQVLAQENTEESRELMNQRPDFTFYPRSCDYKAVTTNDHYDLIWNEDNAEEFDDFSDLMMHHGAGVIEDLLSPAMTRELRDTILLMNEKEPIEKQFDLKERGNRWSLRLNPYDTELDPNKSVQRALKEIATHPTLKHALTDLLGDDPAITEIAAITSDPGAPEQGWHHDTWTENSAVMNARTYSSMYSLFLYVQDTHLDMGPTGFAAGTHMCYEVLNVPIFYLPAKAGSGALLNSNTLHQGSGNEAYERGGGGGPGTRVMFIVTFAPRPRVGLDPRQLPLGSVYGIPWYAWGHNLSELEILDQLKPWNWMHALGLVKSGKNWGINYLLGAISARAEDFNNGNYAPEWFLDREVWTDYASQIDFYAMVAASIYMCVSWILLLIASASPSTSKNYTRVRSAMSTTISFGVFIPCFIATTLYVFGKTEFGRGITQRTRFQAVPFTPLPWDDEMSEDYWATTVKPESYDIVLGERLDAFYTFRNAYYYDYHPGNRHFRNKLKEISDVYINRPEFVTPTKFVQTQIISQLWMQMEDVWYRRAFVRQDDYGYWIRLTNRVSKAEYVRREVLSVAHPVLRVLNKEIDFIMSQCKYGDGARSMAKAQIRRDTAMARVHVPELMEAIREELFEEDDFLKSKMKQKEWLSDAAADGSSIMKSPIMHSVKVESKLQRRMSQWRFETMKRGPWREDFVWKPYVVPGW